MALNLRWRYFRYRLQFCVFILVSLVLMECIVQHQIVQFLQLQIVSPKIVSFDEGSCLNDIFDQIFVISIKSRYDTLSLTLHQLNEEKINYVVWEGHSSANPYSVQLLKQFRLNIDARNHSRWFEPFIHYNDLTEVNKSTLYYNTNAFFLRQTQVDILKYSSLNHFEQILIFEDDILLANPLWINMFCNVFPSMPQWWRLNIGVNQWQTGWKPKYRIRPRHFRSFPNHSDLPMKFYFQTQYSFGTFAIAIHSEAFEELIDVFDMDGERVNCLPMDIYHMFPTTKSRLHDINMRLLNIHPTLVLPDVTTSTMREGREMDKYIQERTTDHNVSHFSKWWNLRFSDELSERESQIERIRATLPSFEEMIRHSPSNEFLKKESKRDY
eukprot:277021_1